MENPFDVAVEASPTHVAPSSQRPHQHRSMAAQHSTQDQPPHVPRYKAVAKGINLILPPPVAAGGGGGKHDTEKRGRDQAHHASPPPPPPSYAASCSGLQPPARRRVGGCFRYIVHADTGRLEPLPLLSSHSSFPIECSCPPAQTASACLPCSSSSQWAERGEGPSARHHAYLPTVPAQHREAQRVSWRRWQRLLSGRPNRNGSPRSASPSRTPPPAAPSPLRRRSFSAQGPSTTAFACRDSGSFEVPIELRWSIEAHHLEELVRLHEISFPVTYDVSYYDWFYADGTATLAAYSTPDGVELLRRTEGWRRLKHQREPKETSSEETTAVPGSSIHQPQRGVQEQEQDQEQEQYTGVRASEEKEERMGMDPTEGDPLRWRRARSPPPPPLLRPRRSRRDHSPRWGREEDDDDDDVPSSRSREVSEGSATDSVCGEEGDRDEYRSPPHMPDRPLQFGLRPDDERIPAAVREARRALMALEREAGIFDEDELDDEELEELRGRRRPPPPHEKHSTGMRYDDAFADLAAPYRLADVVQRQHDRQCSVLVGVISGQSTYARCDPPRTTTTATAGPPQRPWLSSLFGLNEPSSPGEGQEEHAAKWFFVNPVFYLGTFAVLPVLRRCGVGSALLDQFTAYFGHTCPVALKQYLHYRLQVRHAVTYEAPASSAASASASSSTPIGEAAYQLQLVDPCRISEVSKALATITTTMSPTPDARSDPLTNRCGAGAISPSRTPTEKGEPSTAGAPPPAQRTTVSRVTAASATVAMAVQANTPSSGPHRPPRDHRGPNREPDSGAQAAAAGSPCGPISAAALCVEEGYRGGIWLHCLATDLPLLRFYQNRGYQMVHLIQDYYEFDNAHHHSALLCYMPSHHPPPREGGSGPHRGEDQSSFEAALLRGQAGRRGRSAVRSHSPTTTTTLSVALETMAGDLARALATSIIPPPHPPPSANRSSLYTASSTASSSDTSADAAAPQPSGACGAGASQGAAADRTSSSPFLIDGGGGGGGNHSRVLLGMPHPNLLPPSSSFTLWLRPHVVPRVREVEIEDEPYARWWLERHIRHASRFTPLVQGEEEVENDLRRHGGWTTYDLCRGDRRAGDGIGGVVVGTVQSISSHVEAVARAACTLLSQFFFFSQRNQKRREEDDASEELTCQAQ